MAVRLVFILLVTLLVGGNMIWQIPVPSNVPSIVSAVQDAGGNLITDAGGNGLQ